jgi:hypothetical protein
VTSRAYPSAAELWLSAAFIAGSASRKRHGRSASAAAFEKVAATRREQEADFDAPARLR